LEQWGNSTEGLELGKEKRVELLVILDRSDPRCAQALDWVWVPRPRPGVVGW
jgi:hypothetical protein